MGFLTYNDPLIYDDEEVKAIVGEDVFEKMGAINFEEQFKDGGAYKDGVYHGIHYKFLFWTLLKDVNFLTIVTEDGVHYVRSDHIHNLEMDRPWSTKEVYAVTGGIAGAVCVMALSIVSGAVFLMSATSSAVAGASASAISSMNKPAPKSNPIDFPETHANRFERRKMYQQTEEYKQKVQDYREEYNNHLEYLKENQEQVLDQVKSQVSNPFFDSDLETEYNPLFDTDSDSYSDYSETQ